MPKSVNWVLSFILIFYSFESQKARERSDLSPASLPPNATHYNNLHTLQLTLQITHYNFGQAKIRSWELWLCPPTVCICIKFELEAKRRLKCRYSELGHGCPKGCLNHSVQQLLDTFSKDSDTGAIFHSNQEAKVIEVNVAAESKRINRHGNESDFALLYLAFKLLLQFLFLGIGKKNFLNVASDVRSCAPLNEEPSYTAHPGESNIGWVFQSTIIHQDPKNFCRDHESTISENRMKMAAFAIFSSLRMP